MNWPDWTGQPVAIVASGPTTRRTRGLELLQGRVVTFVVKRNIELCPWAAAVYGCDCPWWRSVDGLTGFAGHRFAYDAKARDRYGCTKIEIPDTHDDRILMDEIGTVGSGGNSGFQALNLAVQFGARRIILAGFDMHERGGAHWYGRNMSQGMGNPGPGNFRRWIKAFDGAAPALRDLGCEVINASPDSALRGFRKAGIATALIEWGVLQREDA